ncbi:transcriptional regulator [Psychrobacillus sp. FSL K6-1267]|uniref:transcriptional regulator n=1 Tax=Psychrobacillus sp. FSL K6-1267 TaxID=2921543 RepID=UPI0011A7C040
MQSRIAVLGSTNFIDRLKHFEHEMPFIRLDYYHYNTPKEAKELVKNIKPCAAVFFSGSLPYLYAKKERELLPVPSYYLKQDSTSVATTLLATCHTPIHQVSMDLIEPKLVESVLQDINQTAAVPFLMQIDPAFSLEEVVSFHISLQNAGKTKLAITSVHAVYESLMQSGIPVVRMIDPKNSILKAIEETNSLAILAKSEASKIAVCSILLDQEDSSSATSLNKVTDSIDASIVKVDDLLYMLFTTQGKVQLALESNVVNSWFDLFSTPVRIAFGYGTTVLEASENAKDALKHATKNNIYLMNQEKQLTGPLLQNETKIDLRTNDPRLVLVAKETKLSPANLSKIMQFSRIHHSVEFTAHDLEVFLKVSRRTTERILKKLSDHGYASIVGEEMTYQQGRPRAVYEFNFPTY